MTPRKYSLALVLSIGLVAAQCAAAQPMAQPATPSTIEECESRLKTPVCATWKQVGEDYEAAWPDGSIGHMSLRMESKNGKTNVVIKRADKAGTLSGLVATYSGELINGKVQNGALKWTYEGRMRMAAWEATFHMNAAVEPVAAPAPAPPRQVAQPQPQPQLQASQTPLPEISSADQRKAQELARINATLTALHSDAARLSAQWKELQSACPVTSAEPGCLDKIEALARQIAQNAQAITEQTQAKRRTLR